MKTEPNDSASPAIETIEKNSRLANGTYSNTFSTGGLTKREYFAATALMGMLASGWHAIETTSGMAVEHADALITALNSPAADRADK